MAFDIHISRQSNWEIFSSIYTQGYGFIINEYLNTRDLANQLKPFYSLSDHLNFSVNLNGFFSYIHIVGEELFACVDHVRSTPLFYGIQNNNFYMSDDSEYIKDQMNVQHLDEYARYEYLSSSIVSGSQTLFQEIKQIQSGELLHVKIKNNSIHIDPIHYSKRTQNSTYYQEDLSELLEKLDSVFVDTFERLIQSLEGRPVAIPLSGGYDSRHIAVMLKKLGYPKIKAFTYGKEGNKESAKSKDVANHLSLDWTFVPYTNELWYQWFHSQEMKQYREFSNSISSLPTLQEWPAVWTLKEKGFLSKDTIVIPGHTGDWFAGERIAKYLLYKYLPNKELLDIFIQKNFSYMNWDNLPKLFQNECRKKIKFHLSLDKNISFDDRMRLIELWDKEERQAKFIVNGVRAYEFWGFNWRIPLWDLELLNFFYRVPYAYRNRNIEKNLYDQYVIQQYQNIANIDYQSSQKRDGKIHSKKYYVKIKKIRANLYFYSHKIPVLGYLTRTGFRQLYKTWKYIEPFLKRKKNLEYSYNHDPLCLYGCYDLETIRKFNYRYPKLHSHTLHALYYLEELMKRYRYKDTS